METETRECTTCHEIKPIEEFTYKDKRIKSGYTTRNICRKCNSSRVRPLFEVTKLVRKFITRVKNLAICHDCGQKYPPVVYDFDHLSDKTINLSAFTRFKGIAKLSNKEVLTLLKEEIRKCHIVCANCHRIRTQKRKENECSLL